MKATVHLLNVDRMECRLTVDMTVGELRMLKEQINEATNQVPWPLAGFREIAASAIERAEESFAKEIEGR